MGINIFGRIFLLIWEAQFSFFSYPFCVYRESRSNDFPVEVSKCRLRILIVYGRFAVLRLLACLIFSVYSFFLVGLGVSLMQKSMVNMFFFSNSFRA